MLRRIVSFSPSPGPRGSQSKTSGGDITPASGHPGGSLSLSSHPIKTITEDDNDPQDARAEDAELWEGMSMEELKAQCSVFNLDRDRMVYKLRELEKERDAGIWCDYRDDRLQVAVDSALAAQKRELLAQFSCDQIKALENLRHELQSQFRKQSAQQEAVMRREFAHKMDDILFEKNSIIENMEINRKNLVEQIRKYTARFPGKMFGSPRSPMHARAPECPEEPQSSNALFSQDELVSSLRTVLQDELQQLQAQMLEGMQVGDHPTHT
ncbi:hypothetical protein CYMTET_6303 [Cymbomonas tetramitiformis]|uniref:Uncharacterized protein n=1 Tax=Cymbomonas tetramitiformis TaxID=36881 RepID=A0AAE0LI20_9CHLO|nr:hypothetical protein CYMTET_6303 [Cymbomonas tetramitiformis]